MICVIIFHLITLQKCDMRSRASVRGGVRHLCWLVRISSIGAYASPKEFQVLTEVKVCIWSNYVLTCPIHSINFLDVFGWTGYCHKMIRYCILSETHKCNVNLCPSFCCSYCQLSSVFPAETLSSSFYLDSAVFPLWLPA